MRGVLRNEARKMLRDRPRKTRAGRRQQRRAGASQRCLKNHFRARPGVLYDQLYFAAKSQLCHVRLQACRNCEGSEVAIRPQRRSPCVPQSSRSTRPEAGSEARTEGKVNMSPVCAASRALSTIHIRRVISIVNLGTAYCPSGRPRRINATLEVGHPRYHILLQKR